MKNIKNLIFIVALFLIVSNIFSQVGQNDFSDLNSKIPIDSKVKIGKLDNGLTYYIRYNEKPTDRAEFFLVVNAGAILEDDDQDGLAHFCEHMAFNGTKHFEKHDIINYLQSIGMKFGPEINAFTSTDVTNYMLQKVPTDVKENIDTALLVLFDWSSNVTYEGEEIDKERGVIHEEWRVRRGADFRMGMETDKIIYKGSKYAERDVIGKIDIIDNCPYDALRRFFKDWYRPDLQAIIAIGDFELDEMEKKIIAQFSKIPKRVDAKERKTFEIPDHDGVRIAIAKDNEARFTRVGVMYKHDVVKDKTILKYLRDNLKNKLFTNMLSARLDEISKSENPAFSWAYNYYGSMERAKDAYTTMAMSRNNETERSLEILLTEHKRVKEYGFTEGEFKRAKQETIKWYEKAIKEKDKNESSRYTWTYYSHFLTNNPIPGIEFSYTFAKATIPNINLKEVNELAGKWIIENNMIVVITGPDEESIKIPNEEEVTQIIEKVKNAKIDAYEDVVIDKPLLSTMPKPSKIVKTEENKELGTTEWVLENGAKVVIKQTDFKEDEILFRAYSLGGSSLYSNSDEISVDVCSGVTRECGLGEFNNIELPKYMSGKIANLYTWVGDLTEEMNGNTRPQDFETLLQMIYLNFTNPRFDEKGFNTYVQKQKTWLENKQLDPSNALYDTVSVTMSQYHPRRRPWTMELYKEAKFERLSKIYKERFSNAADFTFFFVGNIDIEKSKILIEKYIGGIATTKTTENWKDLNVRYPNKLIEKEIIKKMKVPKTTVYIIYTGNFDYSLENRVKLDAINDILDVRYTETVREEQGGTYGVRTWVGKSKYPEKIYRLNIRFDCAPEKAEMLTAIIYDEIEKMQKNGPKQKYLDNFIKNKLKSREENLIRNRYWISQLKNSYFNNENTLSDDYVKILKSLTIDDIKKAAEQFLLKDQHAEFVLNPKK